MKKFLEKMVSADAFREALSNACNGTVFSSETDAAVVPFFSEAGGGDFASVVNEGLGRKAVEPLEEIDFDEFFGRLECVRDWYGPEEKRNARRYSGLRRILADNLTGLSVFKAGSVRKEIFVIGRDREGKIAGVRTYSVET